MANVNGLTQPNNQEVIMMEINEEELEVVVGGGILGGALIGTGLATPDTIGGLSAGLKTTLVAVVDLLV